MARSPPSRVRTGGLEAHQVLGQDAIGADFNSLTHMISTDLLVSVYRISPPFARAQRSFVQRYGCSKNRPKKGGCRGCFGSKGTQQGAGPTGSFSRQVSESDADSILMLYRCSACDDYASWNNHRRLGHCAVHRRIFALALAARASGPPPHRTFLSRNRWPKLGNGCRFHWRRLSRSVGPRSGAAS